MVGFGRGGLQTIRSPYCSDNPESVQQHVYDSRNPGTGPGHVGVTHLALSPASFMPTRPDAGEVVVEMAEAALGIGVQAGLQQPGILCASPSATLRKVHHMVEALVEIGLVSGGDRHARHIDGHDAHGAAA